MWYQYHNEGLFRNIPSFLAFDRITCLTQTLPESLMI